MAGESLSTRSERKGALWLLRELYDLLSDPTFAILIVIVLAVASLIGLVIVDQIPFRGEMARMRYADRPGDPWVWVLTHIVPASPFRAVAYRTLLALLSLSLLACTVKRWRRAWRLAIAIGWPPEGAFGSGPSGSSSALVWVARTPKVLEEITGHLRRSLFAVRTREANGTTLVSASRFGLSRLGPVLTHLGFLLLVAGALWIGAAGTSRQVWMSPGDTAQIPESTLRLALKDFRVETTPTGEVSQYISEVTLYDGTALIREAQIAVNKPLRYRSYSVYQSSYRQDPSRVRSIDLVIDAAVGDPVQSDPPAGMAQMEGTPAGHPPIPGRAERPRHEQVPQRFTAPVSLSVPWGDWVALPGTPYTVAIDTFFIDLRIDAQGPTLASDEPRNPAVRLRFMEGEAPAGQTWFFLMHPDMPVGSGPNLPLRVTGYTPLLLTGLDVTTHPGAGWIWAGFAVMTLGTLLAFLLHHERVWLRLRRQGLGWEVALIHQGAPRQAPEYIREPWEASATALGIGMLRRMEPEGGGPVRWPGAGTSEGENA